MIVNDPTFDTFIFRAEAYGRYYQARFPGREAPLSGEFADEITIDMMLITIGLTDDMQEIDGIIDGVCDAFESAYAEQDTDETGWKFPRCVCPRWTHDLDEFEQVARDAKCPAHDGDEWTEYANTHKH